LPPAPTSGHPAVSGYVPRPHSGERRNPHRWRTGIAWQARAAVPAPTLPRRSVAPASALRSPRGVHRASTPRWHRGRPREGARCRATAQLPRVSLRHLRRVRSAPPGARARPSRRAHRSRPAYRGMRRATVCSRRVSCSGRCQFAPQQGGLAVDAVACKVTAAQVPRVTRGREGGAAVQYALVVEYDQWAGVEAGRELKAGIAQQLGEPSIGAVEARSIARVEVEWRDRAAVVMDRRYLTVHRELDQRPLGAQLSVA